MSLEFLEDTRSLLDQLAEALSDLHSSQEGAEEVAILSGLLARRNVQHKTLTQAETWRDSGVPIPENLSDILDSLFSEGVDDLDQEDVLDELLDLDEASAAATWWSRPELAAPAVERAGQVLLALQGEKDMLVELARELMKHAAPKEQDPILALWNQILE